MKAYVLIETSAGKTRNVKRALAKVRAVSAADIKRVANKYLRSDNRTMVVAAPPKNS